MRYHFYTCDVFTSTRFGGNPLAVLPEAEGLTYEQMQLIAREFNYSETTFVFPAEDGHARKVRIFTPKEELPFAGHPNIGTAFTLATIGELGEIQTLTEITFEEKAGLVPITIHKYPEKPIYCELKAPEPLSLGKTAPAELIAAVLSLAPEAIVTGTHLPQVASVGTPFIIIELKDRIALKEARVDIDMLRKLEAEGITPFLYLYVHSNDNFDLRARVFAPLSGITEDPATGSANCALVGMLAHYNKLANGNFSWRIAQGVEMNRPSVLDARAEKQDDVVTDVWIAGNCVMVSEGFILL